MDSDEGKLFIGGVSWETTEEKLVEHFSKYGSPVSAVVMRDKITSKPRGFAFVSFDIPAVLDRVLADQHIIDNRTVEAKRALSREDQPFGRSGNNGVGRTLGGGGGGNTRTKKIFVGGLPATLTNEGLSQYFGKYGDVSDVVVMYDANTQRPRGFGFVTFMSDDSVDKVLAVNNFHELDGKLVEVKRALPKDMNQTNGGGRSASGTHQAYNASPYEVKVAANSYAQPTGGGYPAYGSAGYGAPGGYGYGAANNGLNYGVGGGYGPGGYSGAAPTSGPAGAQRGPWNNQQPTGYGGSGMGAQPGGAAAPGYGNQGYGGYAGAGGSYMNQAGYGGRGAGPANPAGGAGEQGGASAYVDGGFAGAMDTGYQASWRSNPSAGGGYGAGHMSGPPGGPSGYGGYPGQMQ